MAETLAPRFRVIMPDLRGHGDSEVGEGPATMPKHAADLGHVMDDADVGRAPVIGVSIGGYLLFEFWRKSPVRIAALGLCNTKAPADGVEARNGRRPDPPADSHAGSGRDQMTLPRIDAETRLLDEAGFFVESSRRFSPTPTEWISALASC